jgi:YEATS domain-containing protein 4
VRGVGSEDISNYVASVEFTMDPSYPEPIKNITQPPFEVQLTGWGEFNIGIKLYFKDSSMEPVQHQKFLHLFD